MQDVAPELLRAAAEAVGSYGLRRTSLTDVAARAGVSRATIYRAFGDRDRMLRAVGRYEVCRFLQHLERELEDVADPRTLLTRALDESLSWMSGHPVVRRARSTEADLVVGLLVDHPGGTSLFTHISSELAVSFTRLGHASSFALPIENAAEALVRLMFSYLLVPTSTFVGCEQAIDALMNGLAGPNGVSHSPS